MIEIYIFCKSTSQQLLENTETISTLQRNANVVR
jgi:hypothetical protein